MVAHNIGAPFGQIQHISHLLCPLLKIVYCALRLLFKSGSKPQLLRQRLPSLIAVIDQDGGSNRL
ncbi:Uncharacterised protein [Vibrio cholerae]|nr:Uncharacterised protein [Vibrio cholerae]